MSVVCCTIRGMAADLVTGLLAFVGAVIGSAVASWATLRAASADRRERRRASDADRRERRREEWGRRFSDAIGAVTSTDPTSRATGRALLRDLLRSELATDDDRTMAESVLDAAATGWANPRSLVTPPLGMEDITVVRDTEFDEQEGTSR